MLRLTNASALKRLMLLCFWGLSSTAAYAQTTLPRGPLHPLNQSRLQMAQALLGRLPASPSTVKGFMLDGTVTPDDIAYLASRGVTMVRFPVLFTYDSSLNNWLAKANVIQQSCERNGIYFIIEIHHPEPDRGSANIKGTKLTDLPDFYRKWQRIASFFKGRTNVIYELLNECHRIDWHNIACEAATQIRAIDRNTVILYGPKDNDNPRASTVINAAPLTYTRNGVPTGSRIENQMFTVHFWPWAAEGDVQNWVRRAVRYGSTNRTVNDIQSILYKIAELRNRTGIPVIIGEVGIPTKQIDTPLFFNDFLRIADHYRLPTLVHAFKSGDPVWNYQADSATWSVIEAWLRVR